MTLESVYYEGYYIVSRDGALYLEQNPDAEEATFFVSTDSSTDSADVLKTTRFYTVGEDVNDNDILITVHNGDGSTDTVETYTTNADSIDTSTTGTKPLIVSYTYNGESLQASVQITVVDADYRN